MRLLPLLPLLPLLVLLSGCPSVSDDDDSAAGRPFDPGPSPYSLDDVLALPHVQAKGTHNSYHQQPDPVWHPSHRYTHDPLDVQLEQHGVRQFELDLHYRSGAGFEVFHLPSIDDETSCRALDDCLDTMRGWSETHPWHLPIVVWFEPKDEDADSLDPELEELSGKWDEFDETLVSNLGRDRIVTPDEVRGEHATLPEALAAGWPTLGTMRGRFLFAMLDAGAARDEYLDGHPAAAGRILFPDSDGPTDPWAAMFKINDAAAEAQRVAELVVQGFVVTSNSGSADGDDNAEHWAASLAAGANFLSTDLPAVHPTDWFADIPDGAPARCNPVSAPPECTALELENLWP
jgi:hypothetical protein